MLEGRGIGVNEAGQAKPERGAPPALTRRRFVVSSGTAIVALGSLGTVVTRARASSPFPGADQYDAEVPTAWFDLARDLVRTTPGYSPPVASRAFGYAGIALYEALVPGIEDASSLRDVLIDMSPVPAAGKNAAYHWPSVANSALASILRSLFPTARPERLAALGALETSFADRHRPGLPPGVFARSSQRGRDAAAAVFDWSTTDGGHEGYLRNFPPYNPPVSPGFWVPTPPGFLPALQPFWGSNRCLAVANSAVCSPGDHPSYSEDPTSAFYGQALEVYETANHLAQEQTDIARFWSDDSALTATPPGHSVSIATEVLRNEAASLATAAETYAKVGIAVCDAFVACWHQKFAYNLLRPVTYIRRLIDPEWTPLLITPPFPEYTSGHSVQSGAAFQVLTDLFGEQYAFVDHTHDDRGLAPRRFGSFQEAGEEAAMSRLYGGIHYRAAVENGLTQGSCIGRTVSGLI